MSRGTVAGAVACLALLLGTAACAAGEELPYVVAAEDRDRNAWEPLVTVDPDEIAATWGRPADPPDGHVAVLLSAGTAPSPEVTAVRAVDDAWVVEVETEPLTGDCVEPAVVQSVLFLLHVRADSPPQEVRTRIEEHPTGC